MPSKNHRRGIPLPKRCRNRCKRTCVVLCSAMRETLARTLSYVIPPSRKYNSVPVFQFVCQHFYLSSRVSLLIKMNGHLTTGAVSFNVTFVFIFHPNIPLSEFINRRCSRPGLQSPHGLTAFLSLSFSAALYISPSPRVFCYPLLSYNLCFALLLSPKTDWRYLTGSG